MSKFCFRFRIILLFCFIAFSSVAGETLKNGNIEITLLKASNITEDMLEGVNHISFHGPSKVYFQEKNEKFLLDFQSIDLSTISGASSVQLNVNGKIFDLNSITPVLIKGLNPGEVTISVKMFDENKNPLPYTSGTKGHISFKYLEKEPLVTNDAIVLGILLILLALIFYTSSIKTGFWKNFYKYVPALLLCYFLPSVLNSLGIISGESSNLYFVASRYLLPTSLVLLTLSIDLKGILNLGPKAIIMFFAGTIGIIVGGPVAILITSTFAPEIVGGVGPDAVWRGLTTIAGSWIGGGANQTAMFEVFGASGDLFSAMITVDVIVANIWMAFLLYGAGISKKLDRIFNADASAIDEVRTRIENYNLSIQKIPSFPELMYLLAIGFGVTAISHLGADFLAPLISEKAPELANFSLTSDFFWLIVIATTVGLILSFTPARKLEGVGASKMGSVFLYILVASIGMKMNILAIKDSPGLFLVGLIWMAVHVTILLTVGKIIKAPFFFTAVGSQANVGGAASAPIVASAFHPSLAPVGVLLAVLGYAVGTYGAWLCGYLMMNVAP